MRTTAAGPGDNARLIHLSLWAIQVLTFIAFAVAAWMKTTFAVPRLAVIWPWTGELAPWQVRGLGVIDLVGGLGVVLPMLTGIRPGLTIAAALGCAALQLCAMTFHIARGELEDVPVNLVLLAMVLLIAWGRARSRARI